jgi:hypothetical protein
MVRSNTTPKQGGVTGKGFVKGDKRINRNGRPRAFDELRDLAQKIAKEKIKIRETGTVGEEKIERIVEVTRAEAILRQWAASKNPVSQQNFITAAYGKVPDEIVINPNSKIILEVQYTDGTNGESEIHS